MDINININITSQTSQLLGSSNMVIEQHIAQIPSSYTIHNLNIISSTKIHQKVNQVLRIFNILPPVTSTKADQATETAATPVDNATKKPARIVVELKAKANVASKLISIVEISKRDLAKREKEWLESHKSAEKGSPGEQQVARQKSSKTKVSGYRLYQYTTVTTTRMKVKPKPAKQKQKAEEPRKISEQADGVEAETEEPECQRQQRKRPLDDSQDSTAAAQSSSKKIKLDEEHEKHDEEEEHKDANNIQLILKPQELRKGEVNEDEEDDEGFEVMRLNSANQDKQAEQDGANSIKQERDVPVLTIYLAMTPVPELAAAFGEQSNCNSIAI